MSANRFSRSLMAALALLVCGLSAEHAVGERARGEPFSGFGSVEISGRSVRFSSAPSETQRYGRLIYRGGLVLSSPDHDFGGLSGLGISNDGRRIMAVSDRGYMFSARLIYDRDENLSGIGEGAKSSLKGSKGQPLPDEKKIWHDAESLAMGPQGFGGPLWVSYERRHRVETYDFGRLGATAPAKRTKLPAQIRRVKSNSGVEGLARFGPGSDYEGGLLAITEHPTVDHSTGERASGAKEIPGYIMGGPNPGPVWLDAPGGFSVTGLDFHPNGDLLVVERRLGNLFDFSVRVRRVARAMIHPGSHMKGETLFEGGLSYEIDNWEGIAVHTHGNGDVRLTIVSDDNFSPIQQTLLLQFTLVE